MELFSVLLGGGLLASLVGHLFQWRVIRASAADQLVDAACKVAAAERSLSTVRIDYLESLVAERTARIDHLESLIAEQRAIIEELRQEVNELKMKEV